MGQLIFVIDDDADVLEAVGGLLRDEGYEVATFLHGRAALDAIDQGARPAAIILDLMMPVMNGWEFWDRHEDPRCTWRDIPIIVLTATGLRQGAVGHAKVMGKPVGIDELAAAVRQAVSGPVSTS